MCLTVERWQEQSQGYNGASAFWLKPDGTIIGTHGSHTSTVMEMPEIFGLQKKDMETTFAKGEEAAVLFEVISLGFIRIRFQGTACFISVNELNEGNKQLIENWARPIICEHIEWIGKITIIEDLMNQKIYKTYLSKLTYGNFKESTRLSLTNAIKMDFYEWRLVKTDFDD